MHTSQTNELAFSLFGTILVLLPLAFLRDGTSAEMLPLNTFFIIMLILGMSMVVKGFLLQQGVLKASKMIALYAQKTYDFSFDSLASTVKPNDRKALLLTFYMSLIIGSAQIFAQLYVISGFFWATINGWLQ
jgi:uncharacterized membrane protein